MGAKRKAAVLALIRARDQHGLEEWVRSARAPLRLLFSLTYSDDPLVRWRAIEAIGIAAQVVAKDNIENARIFLRGLLWLMNDESGGIGWSAPEAIAEVLLHCPELVGEFGRLLPQYLTEEPFERGTSFALFRLRHLAPELIESTVPFWERNLVNTDPARRAYSWLNLNHIGYQFNETQRRALLRDKGQLCWYDFSTGQIEDVQISEIVGGGRLTAESSSSRSS